VQSTLDVSGAGTVPQRADTKVAADPVVSSWTVAVTSKQPPTALGFGPVPGNVLARLPHKKTTVCGVPNALNASGGEALTMQSCGKTTGGGIGVFVGVGVLVGVGDGVSVPVGVRVAVGVGVTVKVGVGVGVEVGSRVDGTTAVAPGVDGPGGDRHETEVSIGRSADFLC
jgi:hypothetical protein